MRPTATASFRPDVIDVHLADARLRSVARERAILDSRLSGQATELERLRGLVDMLQSQLLRAEQELAQLRGERAQLAIDELVRSIAAAIDAGAEAITGRSITFARAQIKALLSAGEGGAGVTIAPPGTAPAASLSTISVELRALPPDIPTHAVDAAAAAVSGAVLELQAALEGVPGAEAAFAAATELASSPPAPAEVASALQPLARALVSAGAARPALAGRAAEVAAASAAVSSPPTVPQLVDLAAAIRAAAASGG